MTNKSPAIKVAVAISLLLSGCSPYYRPVSIENSNISAIDFTRQVVAHRIIEHGKDSGLQQTLIESNRDEIQALSFGFEAKYSGDRHGMDNLTPKDFENLCKRKGGALKVERRDFLYRNGSQSAPDLSVCLSDEKKIIFGFYLLSQTIDYSFRGGSLKCSYSNIFIVGVTFEPKRPMQLEEFKSVIEKNVLYKPKKLTGSIKMCGQFVGSRMYSSWELVSEKEMAEAINVRKEEEQARQKAAALVRQRQIDMENARREAGLLEQKRKIAEQPRVKEIGAKICLRAGGTQEYVIGSALGRPVTRDESRDYFLVGVTERTVGEQILVRVGSIRVEAPGNRVFYADTLNGEPTYKVGQLAWDQATKWSLCR